jgi:protein-L-isoaspartate(D-aspartate) O-methyltransferase
MKVSEESLVKHYLSLNRRDFLEDPSAYREVDAPLAIGHGQTVSQPSLVLHMTRLLELAAHHRVLEIGTGCGYQSAMIAPFVAALYTVEIIEALHLGAKNRLLAMGYGNIHFKLGDGKAGWAEEAPFDRIIVTAAPSRIPQALVTQLGPGGRMVIPVGDFVQYLTVIEKDREGRIGVSREMAVRFVPLV